MGYPGATEHIMFILGVLGLGVLYDFYRGAECGDRRYQATLGAKQANKTFNPLAAGRRSKQ